ncbi:hypothetical protein BT96DRAFT_999462 [Gymnopus androsaceus JB14]|uniref:Uncharacterized protein n=1 Tax=Gymnopus androsaceus JB14 TaxID=1447944 RepID=A0A6A4H6K1_9AGAR|nr:hypothetical protein BT96DRAFT_999462 [Gymnopus androsaceus JB14]
MVAEFVSFYLKIDPSSHTAAQSGNLPQQYSDNDGARYLCVGFLYTLSLIHKSPEKGHESQGSRSLAIASLSLTIDPLSPWRYLLYMLVVMDTLEDYDDVSDSTWRSFIDDGWADDEGNQPDKDEDLFTQVENNLGQSVKEKHNQEIATGSQPIHDYDQLLNAMVTSG